MRTGSRSLRSPSGSARIYRSSSDVGSIADATIIAQPDSTRTETDGRKCTMQLLGRCKTAETIRQHRTAKCKITHKIMRNSLSTDYSGKRFSLGRPLDVRRGHRIAEAFFWIVPALGHGQQPYVHHRDRP